MAAYPTSIQVYGTRRAALAGTELSRAVNGKPRLRTYYSQTWYEFLVVHDLTTAEKDAILAHYAADKGNVFNFTYKGDDATYSVRYIAAPEEEPTPGQRWRVTVRLVGV